MAVIRFDILTLFPDMIEPYLEDSILHRAQEKGLISVELHNWREFADDKHKHVDDRTFGGGSGMLLKVEPLYKQLKVIDALKPHDKKTRVIMMTPEGKPFTHKKAVEMAKKYDRIVLIAGRYEGFDARIEKFVDEKISIGPYVLSGGELPALTVLEAVSRQIPGVLGHSEEALSHETFVHGEEVGEYPQYTRPEVFETEDGKKLAVPKVLMSGNHKLIEEWRTKHRRKLGKTLTK